MSDTKQSALNKLQKLLMNNSTLLGLDIPLFEKVMKNGELGLYFDPKHLISLTLIREISS